MVKPTDAVAPRRGVVVDCGEICAGVLRIRNTDSRLAELKDTIKEVRVPTGRPMFVRTKVFSRVGVVGTSSSARDRLPRPRTRTPRIREPHFTERARPQCTNTWPTRGDIMLSLADGAYEKERGFVGAVIVHLKIGVSSFGFEVCPVVVPAPTPRFSWTAKAHTRSWLTATRPTPTKATLIGMNAEVDEKAGLLVSGHAGTNVCQRG